MLIRISLGMLLYVFVSILFGESASFCSLGLSIFFVLLPLADWLLYLPLRKRYKLVSHYFWYYPLLYVPVGSVAVLMISGNACYYVVLFALNSLANFVHATYQTPQGLQWFAPISWISISLYGNKLRIFSAEERKEFLAKKYEEYKERARRQGRKDEMRTPAEEASDRRHPRGWRTKTLLVVSILYLVLFFLLSKL